jgi:type IV pilus assembly protein PilE
MKKFKNRGFTLIELMIVVTVIAILAGVAYPSYINSVRKARRADAQVLMLDSANRQEQYLLDARQYTTSFTSLGVTKDGWSCSATACTNAFYSVTITVDNSATPPTFSIAGTATGDQTQDGNIGLNSMGTKTPSDKW